MTDKYIIDEHGDVVPEADLMRWAEWLERHNPVSVARTVLPNGIFVSTIFLGLDHSFGEGLPLLFETIVFLYGGGGSRLGPNLDQRRYPDWASAAADHLAMCAEYAERRPGD